MGIFTHTKSVVTVSLIAALLSALLFGFLFERIVRLNRASAALEVSIVEEGARNSDLGALQNLLTELHEERTALDGRFLGPEGIVPFIELLEKSARDAGVGVEVVAVSLEPVDEGLPYEWLRVALSADGSWQKLFHFLVLIESLPYATTLEQTALSASEEVWEGKFVVSTAKLTAPTP